MEIRQRNQLYDMKMRLDGHGVMRKSQVDANEKISKKELLK